MKKFEFNLEQNLETQELSFSKESITELTADQMMQVEGGTTWTVISIITLITITSTPATSSR